MDEDFLKVFCKEYAIERSRLNAEAEQGRGALEKELATANRDHGKLVDAVTAGIPADQARDKMPALSNADRLLEAQEALRALINRIVMQPSPETDKLDIFLEGALSGILTLALESNFR